MDAGEGPPDHIRALFASIDTDHSGYLTVDELEACLFQMGIDDLDDRKSKAANIMEMMDTDADGHVTLNEFWLGARALQFAQIHEDRSHVLTRAKSAFDEIDEDDNGQLDQNELTDLALRLGMTPNDAAQQVSELMTMIDTDEDGVISWDEFAQAVQQGILDHLVESVFNQNDHAEIVSVCTDHCERNDMLSSRLNSNHSGKSTLSDNNEVDKLDVRSCDDDLATRHAFRSFNQHGHHTPPPQTTRTDTIPRAKYQFLWELFCATDSDNDGSINEDELFDLLNDRSLFKSSHISHDLMTEVLKSIDINHDGRIDFEEFCVAFNQLFEKENTRTAHGILDIENQVLQSKVDQLQDELKIVKEELDRQNTRLVNRADSIALEKEINQLEVENENQEREIRHLRELASRGNKLQRANAMSFDSEDDFVEEKYQGREKTDDSGYQQVICSLQKQLDESQRNLQTQSEVHAKERSMLEEQLSSFEARIEQQNKMLLRIPDLENQISSLQEVQRKQLDYIDELLEENNNNKVKSEAEVSSAKPASAFKGAIYLEEVLRNLQREHGENDRLRSEIRLMHAKKLHSDQTIANVNEKMSQHESTIQSLHQEKCALDEEIKELHRKLSTLEHQKKCLEQDLEKSRAKKQKLVEASSCDQQDVEANKCNMLNECNSVKSNNLPSSEDSRTIKDSLEGNDKQDNTTCSSSEVSVKENRQSHSGIATEQHETCDYPLTTQLGPNSDNSMFLPYDYQENGNICISQDLLCKSSDVAGNCNESASNNSSADKDDDNNSDIFLSKYSNTRDSESHMEPEHREKQLGTGHTCCISATKGSNLTECDTIDHARTDKSPSTAHNSDEETNSSMSSSCSYEAGVSQGLEKQLKNFEKKALKRISTGFVSDTVRTSDTFSNLQELNSLRLRVNQLEAQLAVQDQTISTNERQKTALSMNNSSEELKFNALKQQMQEAMSRANSFEAMYKEQEMKYNELLTIKHHELALKDEAIQVLNEDLDTLRNQLAVFHLDTRKPPPSIVENEIDFFRQTNICKNNFETPSAINLMSQQLLSVPSPPAIIQESSKQRDDPVEKCHKLRSYSQKIEDDINLSETLYLKKVDDMRNRLRAQTKQESGKDHSQLPGSNVYKLKDGKTSSPKPALPHHRDPYPQSSSHESVLHKAGASLYSVCPNGNMHKMVGSQNEILESLDRDEYIELLHRQIEQILRQRQTTINAFHKHILMLQQQTLDAQSNRKQFTQSLLTVLTKQQQQQQQQQERHQNNTQSQRQSRSSPNKILQSESMQHFRQHRDPNDKSMLMNKQRHTSRCETVQLQSSRSVSASNRPRFSLIRPQKSNLTMPIQYL